MSFKFSLAFLVEGERQFLERYGFFIPPELNRETIRKHKDNDPELMRMYERLRQLPEPETPYFCSSDYESIAGVSAGASGASLLKPPDPEIRDRILGGWRGRAVGCISGAPLECDLTLPEIKELLGADFPMDHYLRQSVAEKIALKKRGHLNPEVTIPCSRERIAFAMADDDLNYTILNLLLLEKKGFSFSRQDIGELWAYYLTPGQTYGAETTAFVNFLWGLPAEAVPVYLNPFRDEIGAQIRADMFGYVCPSEPQAAAALAFREASFSHVADGIYGAMGVAAMIAAAFSVTTMEAVVAAGLANIPRRSRISELLEKTVEWHLKLGDWEAVYEQIKAATPQYGAGHTVNNAAYVANALLASKGNFEKGIAIACMQGHDTDCNAATVGSILGVHLGAARLPGKWVRPLNDRMKSSLAELSEVAISEMAERTFQLILNRRKS